VRLTTRRLRATLPQSMKEIQVDKDLLRAQFAMTTRRLEINLEHLRDKNTGQVVELSKRDDVINHLKLQRDMLRVDVVSLNAQLEAFNKQPVAVTQNPTAKTGVLSLMRHWVPQRSLANESFFSIVHRWGQSRWISKNGFNERIL